MAKTKNKYLWSDNVSDAPRIEAHTKIKHGIIKDYISSYLKVVGNPGSSHIKLVIVDGFCGGGLYQTDKKEAHFGTPIIILDALRDSIAEIVANRAANNIKRPFSVECELYFIDKDKRAIEVLKKVAAPHLVIDKALPLKINHHFINDNFSEIYSDLLTKIGKLKSIFILDPCGYSEMPLQVIKDIMRKSGDKREIIWTFMIGAMKGFATVDSPGLINAGYDSLLKLFNSEEKPSGFCVQKEIYHLIKDEIGIPFFTPFAIKNKFGWGYWLIHLAHHYRASEVMKEVEHKHADEREHYGGSGLNMMAAEGKQTYLFRNDDVERGRVQLQSDIPELLSRPGFSSVISFKDFMETAYNQTPLVSNVIKETLVAHSDIEIFTIDGGKRTSAKRIKTNDIIKLKQQKHFFFN